MRLAVLNLSVLASCAPILEDPDPDPEPEPASCGQAPDRAGCTSADDCAPDARDSSCGGEIWECDPASGEWEHLGWCDPGFLQIQGPVTVSLTFAPFDDPACPAIEARDPVVLIGTPEEGSPFTADPPIAVVSAATDTSVRPATADVTLTDEWTRDGAAVTPEVHLLLELDDDGVVTGLGTAFLDGCDYRFDVAGSYEPVWGLSP